MEPGELKRALVDEKRPPSDEAELLMINTIVECVKRDAPKAKREIMHPIVDEIVNDYPASFIDKVGTATLGYGRFLKHCKDQWDNKGRGGAKKREAGELFDMPVKSVLGCEEWQAIELPAEETEDSQRLKQKELQDMSKVAHRDLDKDKVKDLCDKTYPAQRVAILKMYKKIKDQQKQRKKKKVQQETPETQTAEMTDLVQSWPFLFRPIGSTIHFERLTKRGYKHCLDTYFMFHGEDMLQYLIKNGGVACHKIEKRLQKCIEKNAISEPKFLALILLLSNHFKEDPEKFLVTADVSQHFNILLVLSCFAQLLAS